MPEFVLAEGKEPSHLAEIAQRQAETAGRCVITRVTPEQVAAIQDKCAGKGITCEYKDVARILILSKGRAPEKTGGVVAVITAGTSDIRVAEEAKVIAEEMGCVVRTAYDVGAAGIHRLFPALQPLIDADVFIVCAGREGTLPGRCSRACGYSCPRCPGEYRLWVHGRRSGCSCKYAPVLFCYSGCQY